MLSPDWLFLYPGFFLILLGLAGTAVLSFTSIRINNVSLDVHTMLFSVLMVILGVQVVSFSVITHAYARIVKLYPAGVSFIEKLSSFSLEKGLLLGIALFLAGLGLSIAGVAIWAQKGFGDLMPSSMLRILLPAVLALAIGVQIMFTSFLLGVFKIRTKITD